MAEIKNFYQKEQGWYKQNKKMVLIPLREDYHSYSISFFQKSFCKEFSPDQKKSQFMRSTQLRYTFLLLNGFSIPWQSHVYLLFGSIQSIDKVQGNQQNRINNGSQWNHQCFFSKAFFSLSLFLQEKFCLLKKVLTLSWKALKLKYVILVVLWVWSSLGKTANMFIACEDWAI